MQETDDPGSGRPGKEMATNPAMKWEIPWTESQWAMVHGVAEELLDMP